MQHLNGGLGYELERMQFGLFGPLRPRYVDGVLNTGCVVVCLF